MIVVVTVVVVMTVVGSVVAAVTTAAHLVVSTKNDRTYRGIAMIIRVVVVIMPFKVAKKEYRLTQLSAHARAPYPARATLPTTSHPSDSERALNGISHAGV